MIKSFRNTDRLLIVALVTSALIVLMAPRLTKAQDSGNCAASVGDAFLDINEVKARIPNNGQLFWKGYPNVYEVPQGRGVNAIFASSIWLGGLVDDELRFAGSKYGPFEFWSGPLDDNGQPPADCSLYDKVWKISKEDIAEYLSTGKATPDMLEWPTGLGAPTLDAQGEPIDLTNLPLASRVGRAIDLASGELPDITGDQMLWWIMNDVGNVHEFSKTLAIGAEVHGSAFAFNVVGPLGFTTFYRYRIKIKGSSPLENAYMGIFADPDLGAVFDDYVGSDSTLGLGYVYNADNDDDQNYGVAPPAVGYDFVQGPLIAANGVDDNRNGKIDEPDERRQMTSFAWYSSYRPETVTDFYNYLQGKWGDGGPYTVGGNGLESSNIETKFIYPGNPPEYWSEFDADNQGTSTSPADRQFHMSTGPFTMQPGGEQTIVFSITTSFGADNLDSVRQLKEDNQVVQQAFDNGFQDLIAYSNPSFGEPGSLVAPADGSQNHPPDVRFYWNGDLGQNDYQWRVQYAEHANMEFAQEVSTTANEIVLPLKENTPYWWRVGRVGPRNYAGSWSQTWFLQTGDAIPLTIESIEIVANAAGPIIPPGMGAIAIDNNGFPLVDGTDRPAPGQQASNASRWGIHTGGSTSSLDGTWAHFVSRVMRNGWADVIPFDYEVRFTESCFDRWKTSVESGRVIETNPVADGCYGYNRFIDGWSLSAVPFEVWRTGIGTPEDPSDDVRLIVAGLDHGSDGWGIRHLDHGVSDGDDDPQTDWNYWFLPNDLSPGQSGYQSWLNGVISNYGSRRSEWAGSHGPELFSRIVFVSLDGGSVAEGERSYGTLAMPEAGTVFRINTSKPVVPVLSAPQDGTVSAPASVRFFWTASPHPISLQIYRVGGLIRDIPNASPGMTVPNLPGGVLIWRVGSDQYGWSETWTVNVVSSTATALMDELPSEVELSPNYPNPFNPQTTIQFGLPEASGIHLDVFDTVGRRVKSLVNGQLFVPGRHSVTFDGSRLASGVYIYRLRTGNTVITKTMTLVK